MENLPLSLRQAAAIINKRIPMKPANLQVYARQGRIPTIMLDHQMYYDQKVVETWVPVKKPKGAKKKTT